MPLLQTSPPSTTTKKGTFNCTIHTHTRHNGQVQNYTQNPYNQKKTCVPCTLPPFPKKILYLNSNKSLLLEFLCYMLYWAFSYGGYTRYMIAFDSGFAHQVL